MDVLLSQKDMETLQIIILNYLVNVTNQFPPFITQHNPKCLNLLPLSWRFPKLTNH